MIGKINKKNQIKIFSIALIALLAMVYAPQSPVSDLKQATAATETKWASSHLTISGGALNPDNALGNNDGVWAGELNTSTDWTSRWAMENPSGQLTGTQTISILARKGSNSNSPDITVTLFENGSSVQTIINTTSVTSTTGQVISGTFDASVISNPDDVEIEIFQNAAAGSGSARNSAQIDEIEWTVNLASFTISGTSDKTSGTVRVAINGSLDAATGSIAGDGTWSISGATVTSGQTIVVWVDGVAESSEATAVAKYDGAGSITGLVLNSNILSIGSVDNQSITLSNLGLYDCDQDEDIMYSSNSGTLSVDGCGNNYSSETLQVETGDTLSPSSETVTTTNLTINGTYSAGGTTNTNVTGNITIASGGTFTKGSGTLTFNKGGGGTQTVTDSNATKQDLGTVQVSANTGNTTLSLGSDIKLTKITVDSSQTFAPSSRTVTITGSGTGASRPFVNNGTFTESTSTIDYEGTAATDVETTNVTYYNLKVGTTSDTNAAVHYNLNGNLTVSNVATVGNASSTNTDYLDIVNTTLTFTGSGTPFVLTSKGDLYWDGPPNGSPTVKYLGSSATTLAATTYYNLELGTTSDTNAGVTYSLGGSPYIYGIITVGNASSTNTDTFSFTGSGTLRVDGYYYSSSYSADVDYSPFVLAKGAFTASASSTVSYYAPSTHIAPGTYGILYFFCSGTSSVCSFTLPNSNIIVGAQLNIDNATGTGINFVKGSGTIIFENNSGATVSYANTTGFYSSDIGDIQVSAGTSGNTTLSIGSNVKVSNITIDASQTLSSNATITVTGANFINNGTFTTSTGTVVFSSTGTVDVKGSSSTTFNNFTANGSGATVRFKAGNTYTFNGLLTLTGVTVTSDTGSSSWTINHQGTESITSTAVSWSACDASSTTITVTSGTDGGNNGTCWSFPATTITISGTTNAGDGITVAVAINGSLAGQTGTTATSAWSISNVTVNSGEVVVVFFDGVADSAESTAVAKYDGSGDMTGIVLNTNVLSIGSADNQSLTYGDLDTYDCNSDEDVMYATSATSLAVEGCTNSYSDETIQIESGDTLTEPSGSTFTSDNLTISGTLTQTTTGTITLTGNLSSSGTFNGGSGAVSLVDFSITGGSYSAGSATYSVTGNWTYTAGTLDAGTSTVSFSSTANHTITGTHSLKNVTFNASGATRTYTISAGTVLTVNGTFTTGGTADVKIDTGDIYAKGDINLALGCGTTGTATITINGSTDQTMTGSSNVGDSCLPNIVVDKSGTLNLVNAIGINGNWTLTTGTVSAGSSTIYLTSANHTITGTQSLNNLRYGSSGATRTLTIASGTTLTLLGSLTISGSTNITINTGNLNIEGDIVSSNSATTSGSAVVTLTGSNSQTINQSAGTISIALTVNKTNNSDTVTLANNLTLGSTLTITKGVFDQGASYNLTSGAVTVGASGTWQNTGTGDIVLSGNVSNSGAIILKANNTLCGGTDDITITSSVGGTQRDWTGAGTFTIYNVDATDQKSTTSVVTAYSSTLTNTTWTVGSCGITISGTTNAGDGITVAVAVNGSLAGQTGTTATSAWSISNVTVNSGEVVVVFFDGVADSAESTAVAKYDGAGSMTNIVLNANVLSIGSVDDQSLTVTNLGTYDCSDDEDIMHYVNGSTLEVEGSACAGSTSNSYTDETIEIESGDTLTIGSSETLSAHNVTINGTLTGTTTATFNVSGAWDNNSVFNKGTSTANFTSSSTETVDSTGSTTSQFNVVNFSGGSGQWTLNSAFAAADSVTVSGGTLVATSTVTGASTKTFQVNNGTTFRMTGSGSFPTTFSTYTFESSSTVQYQQTTVTVTAATYGNLTLGGTGTYTMPASTITIKGNLSITNNATVTKGAGTVLFNSGSTQTWTDNSSGAKQDLGAVQISASGTNTTLNLGSSAKATSILIDNNQTFSTNGSNTLTLTSTGTPLTIGTGSTFTASSGSTVDFTGNGATIVATTYYHLGLKPSSTSQQILLGGTLTINGNLTVGNGSNNGASASANNPTISVSGTTTIDSGATFTTGTGTWTQTGNLTITGTLSGTANGTISAAGSVTGDGTVNLTSAGTFEQRVGSNKNFGPTGSNNWAFVNLTFGRSAGTPTITTSSTGSGNITVSNVLNIGKSGDAGATVLDAGDKTWTLSATSTPLVFNASSTLTADASTFRYTGNGATITTADYYNLELKPSSTSPQILSGGTVNVSGGLTVGDGTNAGATASANTPTINVTGSMTIAANATFVSTSDNLTIGDDLTISGTFTHNSGTVTLDTTTTATISGATTFNNFTAATSGKTVQFTAGQTFTFNGLLTLTGVTVTSSTGSSTWTINHQGTESINGVTISWSACHASSTDITVTTGSSGGNNGACWDFPATSRGGSGGPSLGGGSGGATAGATLPQAFTAADATALTTYNSNWSLNNGNFAINTNSVYSNTAATNTMASWTVGTFNNDQYSEMTITAVTTGGYIGVAVRTQSGAHSGYGVYCNSTDLKLIEWNAGSATTHYTGSACSANDLLRLEISGTTLTVKRNGTTLTTFTDATYASGRPGIVGNGNSSSIRGDNWMAGSVDSGGSGGGTEGGSGGGTGSTGGGGSGGSGGGATP